MVLATALTLLAAVLHASWNLIAKTSDDRELALVGQFVIGGVLAAAALCVVGLPGRDAAVWLALSACVHVLYVLTLVWAYEQGDFSFAYPLARGGGAMLAATGGVLLLGDRMTLGAWVAIAVIAGGLVALVGTQHGPRSTTAAILTASTIGAYTIIDSHGSRASVSGQSYGVALLAATGLTVGVTGLIRRGVGDLVDSMRSSWWRYLFAGASGVAAYTLVLTAVRHAPVGYVSMLRESSVVIAALAGWLLLHESMGRRRLIISAVLLAGMVGLVWSNV